MFFAHSLAYCNMFMQSHRANALTPLQTSSLHALVDANNQTVKRIFLAYESDKDVYALIDSLKALRLDPEDGDDEEEEVRFNHILLFCLCLLCILPDDGKAMLYQLCLSLRNNVFSTSYFCII